MRSSISKAEEQVLLERQLNLRTVRNKKVFKIIVSLALLFLLSITNSFSQTSVAFASKALAVEKVVQSGLNKFDGILDRQQRELFVNASNLIGVLKTQFSDVFSDIEKELTRKQIEVFNDLTRIELELTKVLEEQVDQVADVALDIQNTITRLPFTRRFPTPTEVDIPVFTHQQEGVFSITIKGINLKSDKNYIILNGRKYTNPTIPSVKENTYKIALTNNDVFSDSLNVLEIHLFKKRFLRGTKEYIYTTNYSVLPKEIAKVKVFYETREDKRVYTSEFKEIVAKTPGSCSWSQSERNVNRRGSDRKIDLTTVRILKQRSARGGSDCHFHRNASTEFSIRARARAKRCCNPFNCGTGRTECAVYWKEYKIVDDYKPQTVIHDLLYDTQEVIELPKNTSKFIKTQIEFYNGKSIVIDDPIFEKHFVKFKYDAARQQVYLAFKASAN